MIAVDTNLLVYAHRGDSSWHEAASGLLSGLAEGAAAWAIPWPCIYEFAAVVTHPSIFDPPTPLTQTLDQVDAWMASPSVQLLSESGRYWSLLRNTLSESKVIGARTHDARIAALCRHHGVRELWSADRDFSRFQGLAVRNPLLD